MAPTPAVLWLVALACVGPAVGRICGPEIFTGVEGAGDSSQLDAAELSVASVDTVTLTGCSAVDLYGIAGLPGPSLDLLLDALHLDGSAVKSLSIVDSKLDADAIAVIMAELRGTAVEVLDVADNSFGKQGLQWVLGNIGETNISLLTLASTGLDKIALQDMTEWLCSPQSAIKECRPPRHSLTWLDLSRNDFGDAIVEVASILEADRFADLSFADCNLGSDIVDNLAEAVDGSSILRSLNLAQNPLGMGGAALIGADSGLSSLNLDNTNLGDEGAKSVANFLRLPTCRIEELRIGMNSISDTGAKALSHTILPGLPLRRLSLYANDITDAGAQAIAAALEASPEVIQELDLEDNQVKSLYDIQALVDVMVIVQSAEHDSLHDEL